MRLSHQLANGVRGGIVELARPGESQLSGRELWLIGRVATTVVIVTTNLVGACVVLALALVVVPLPPVDHPGHVRLINGIAAAAYVALAVPVGVLIGTRRLFQLRRWLIEERPATAAEQRLVLGAPLRLFVLQIGLWLGASAVFAALNAFFSGSLAARVGIIVALTGVTTATCAYLLAERILRPAAARALANATPEQLGGGVATRAVLAWAFGTGLPVLGLGAIGIFVLAGDRPTQAELAVAMITLSATAITVGMLAVGVAARATAAPLDSLRRALARVQRGQFDVNVAVYDGTQIGQLQLGFNQMVKGLAERERIREAFGTYVDPDVAEHIVREGTSLEGEEVEVTVMFVDVRDFTGFAERMPAREVVSALNHVFDRVVPAIHAHGGRVDKFIGDGLLAVFGAPRRQPDHADKALAAALEIQRAVNTTDTGELEIGIGLNSGTVLAGNVGAAGRLEFSVIGDPVNIAARVEAATRKTGDTILLAEQTKQLLQEPDVPLVMRPDAELKGKTQAVTLYAPHTGAGRSSPANAR